ncbi:formate/nitrite transporter family protein [Corynebacterium sp. HS2168-gen11]|uniref:formate/nitrite transporter family protein n=1 Tax=Corynebacterium sp. HS2168-gen11 TaxID=2974027 RepID=UPI00216B49AB|nr:formate/nitrite transporter family protein [Corynebacterium sp. HS2168-gen11]MCS4535668.1 formate/nitrite transporter family protein [Corynebacterium sp. HS2168-gen11]
MNTDLPRYFVRTILAGAYLTLGTAFSAVMGDRVEQLFPGLGLPVFAMFFFVGLASIIFLNAELTTSNMMYVGFGLVRKNINVANGAKLLVLCTIGNLVGAALAGAALGQAYIFGHMDADHLASVILHAKMVKPSSGIFVEAIIANFVVNMAIIAVLLLKDATAKFFTLVVIIGMFVGLATEHVIANFSLVNIVGFAAHPYPEHFDVAHVLHNWLFAWLGNFVGGGLLMGAVYGWLNKGNEAYRD